MFQINLGLKKCMYQFGLRGAIIFPRSRLLIDGCGAGSQEPLSLHCQLSTVLTQGCCEFFRVLVLGRRQEWLLCHSAVNSSKSGNMHSPGEAQISAPGQGEPPCICPTSVLVKVS